MNLNSTPAKSNRSDLYVRTVSGVVMVVVAVACLRIGGWLFVALVGIIAVVMATEWVRLTRSDGPDLKLLGVAYVLFPIGSILIIRHGGHGFWLTLWTLTIVWATDIGAYFCGRYFGGPKLAPSISPAKTWSGLAGGAVTAGVVGPIVASCGHLPMLCFVLGTPLGLLAQLGDLFESWLKRRVGVKDSGTILPGHGGVLDRLDGVVPVATVMGLLKLLGVL